MAKPFEHWTVLPHGALTHLDDRLLSVTGTLHMPPMGEVERRMTIVRLRGKRLVVYSAIALREAEMSELERFGKPTYVIVPNMIHRMDVRAWKQRYPYVKVIAPAGAREKVEEVVPVDATTVDFDDPHVQLVTLPGTGEQEASLIIESDTGTTLVLNDVIFNLANRRGIRGWIFKKVGLTGDEPHIAPPVRMRLVKDKDALREQLESWSRLPALKRIVVSHGPVIANDPARVLNRIAKQLAA